MLVKREQVILGKILGNKCVDDQLRSNEELHGNKTEPTISLIKNTWLLFYMHLFRMTDWLFWILPNLRQEDWDCSNNVREIWGILEGKINDRDQFRLKVKS